MFYIVLWYYYVLDILSVSTHCQYIESKDIYFIQATYHQSYIDRFFFFCISIIAKHPAFEIYTIYLTKIQHFIFNKKEQSYVRTYYIYVALCVYFRLFSLLKVNRSILLTIYTFYYFCPSSRFITHT